MDSGGEKRSVSFLLQIESYPGLTGFPPNESTRFTVHSVNFDGMRKSWGSWIEIRYGKEIDARGSVSKHRSIAISWVVNCIVDLWFFFFLIIVFCSFFFEKCVVRWRDREISLSFWWKNWNCVISVTNYIFFFVDQRDSLGRRIFFFFYITN